MCKSEYLEAFRVQKLLMTLTGIWPKPEHGFWYKFYGFLASLMLPDLFIASSILTVFSDSTDIAQGSYLAFCSLTTVFYSAKLIIFYVNRGLFGEILDDLEQPLFTSYPNQLDYCVKKAVVISVNIRKLIQFPCVFLIMFMATYPLLDGNGSNRPLPFAMPINQNELSFFAYITIYCLEIIAAAICACNNLNMDTLACSLISLGTAQLEILVESLKISAKMEQNLEDYGKFDKIIARNVRKCAKHHIAISKYVEKLEEMFTYSFLAQFINSLVVICITGFTFFVIPVSNILFWTCLSYFAAAMIEIGMYCVFGDELIIQSLKVREACYMSEWTNCGLEIRKTLLIIMERSKKPFILTAGKFAILSRESLVTIYKSSFSYLTVLRKMYGTEK